MVATASEGGSGYVWIVDCWLVWLSLIWSILFLLIGQYCWLACYWLVDLVVRKESLLCVGWQTVGNKTNILIYWLSDLTDWWWTRLIFYVYWVYVYMMVAIVGQARKEIWIDGTSEMIEISYWWTGWWSKRWWWWCCIRSIIRWVMLQMHYYIIMVIQRASIWWCWW